MTRPQFNQLLDQIRTQRDADRAAHAEQLAAIEELTRKVQALKTTLDGRVSQ